MEFCESVHITQSISIEGRLYDNAPMERYFKTLKNECTNLYEFQTEETLYQTVEEFAYVSYNHVRLHSFNGYRPPIRHVWHPKKQCIPSEKILGISVTKTLDHNTFA